MNKFLLLLLFIFYTFSFAQEEKPFAIQNIYLQELLNTYNDGSFNGFDIDSKDWRNTTAQKITSKSNIQENTFLKTAMILYMLKYKLGDEVFNHGLENYKAHLSSSKNTKADILDFQYFLENESGEELTHFFNDWFKSKGHPSYEVSWFQNKKSKEVSFTIKQQQSHPSVSFFELPLPIKLIGENDTSQLVRLEISENGQSFSAQIPFDILSVEIDPESHLISKDNLVKIGIDQEILSKEISLYPNPAVNFLKVNNSSEAKVEKVSIYNMLGKLIIEKQNPLTAINIKSLATGVHLVKIETTQGTIHKTLLKN